MFKSDSSFHRVVFIQCDSEQLIALEHKPHFPASEFHITLYEGNDVEFADRLLDTLERYPWMFRVNLPDLTTLTQVQLKRPGRLRGKSRPKLASKIKLLFSKFSDEELSWTLIERLTGAERLHLVQDICENLHRMTSEYRRVLPIPNEHKREDGNHNQEWESDVHLTPPELAKSIAAYAVSLLASRDGPIHFGDPAVGNGAFYSALLQILPTNRIDSAVGVEINSRQVKAAQARWSHRGLKVMQADYLNLDCLEPRTLVLANPPYLRHQDIPIHYKKQLRERASIMMKTVIDAKAGQYVYFLILSHKWLDNNAIAAWLIPSGFMEAQYGSVLRRYLTEEVTLIRIHQYSTDDPQFENVMVLPVVVVFRNKIPDPSHSVTLSTGGTLDDPDSSRALPVSSLRSREKWSVSSRGSDVVQTSVHVGDLFSVRRGIATGANDFFILPYGRAKSLGFPEIVLRPILPKSRQLKSDIIERRSNGWPDVEPLLCVIDCKFSEEVIASQYPQLDNYLSSAEARGILKRNLVRRRNPWYSQERRSPAIFLCTYMGRGSSDRPPLRFIWNKSNGIATNAYLMMYPNKVLSSVFANIPYAKEEVFALLRRAASETISQCSRMYSGGLQKIEPRALLEVGLPGVPEWLLRVARSARASDSLWDEKEWPEAGML